ncbi:hypothetical protein O6H91_09G088300 [Diphasiastrum complanatum]|uniref:Uncharacterized protein n=1 Tax=Diphasiastrum complanatum TaxID=34168 RepID=A0ACC2CRL4_DIPCM|nr:hypothetical protein O6H91_09G088300 [Diphasiastrum complanatum]
MSSTSLTHGLLLRGGCNNSGGGAWYHVPELSLRNHYFNVPLDYSLPSSPLISLFAREVVSAGKEEKCLPYLLFLQGGPGFECHRPLESNGWLKRACEDYRVILMDQRGTGLSTPLTAQSMAQLESAKEEASYLQHFRADNIVRDAELIRSFLVPNGEPWSVLGQSYGGFCAITYLSMAPTGLRHVILTGVLPPLDGGCSAEAVYRACFKRVLIQNFKYYERFPQDEEVVREVVLYLAENEGGVSFLLHFNLSSHEFKLLKYQTFYENWLDFGTNPLYAVMQESIYCQAAASKWAAQRVREEMGVQFEALLSARKSAPVLFTGEMVFPWMFDEIAALRPLKEAAYILADKVDWPYLYNKEVLRMNKVPVVAAVFYEDMYVNFNISEATASRIAGIRVWVTNEYMHSGLREDGVHVLDQLLGMLKGKHLLP